MEEAVLSTALSVISLLFMATLVTFLLRNSKIPYTVVLVLVGLGLGFVSEEWHLLVFLEDFRLSPQLVFYVFLPTLIFESAFHTNIKHFTQNRTSILSLSTVGMLISTGLVGWGVHEFIHFPWSVALLFGALISATDPISVLANFKKMGAPKRLATIVEGESLFNDGMALVLFGILLEGSGGLLGSFWNFTLVVFGGLLTGVVMGFVFSKALDYVRNSKEVEISITLILAHATFIVAEYFLGVSGILATVAAGIVIGNYGAYKISPGVKEIMTHFWDYSAYLANSLLFLMVGLIIYSSIDLVGPLLIPMILAVLIVILARMIMVYTVVPVVNFVSRQEPIPLSWMHVIQWSGLRGALAIALILTLPESFPHYEELLIFTVGVIFFTIIVNGVTIRPLLELFGLGNFNTADLFEYEETQVIIDKKVNDKLTEMVKKGFISKEVYQSICNEYARHCEGCNEHISELFESNRDELSHDQLALILRRHLLGTEKRVYTKLYYYGEITQTLLNVLLQNVNLQMEKLHSNEKVSLGDLSFLKPNSWLVRQLENFGFKHFKKRLKRKETMLRYEMYRARVIGSTEVLEVLNEIKEANVYLDKSVITEFERKYKKWRKNAKEKLLKLEKKDAKACRAIQMYLARQAAFHVEDKVLQELHKSGMTSNKIYAKLRKDLDYRQGNLNP